MKREKVDMHLLVVEREKICLLLAVKERGKVGLLYIANGDYTISYFCECLKGTRRNHVFQPVFRNLDVCLAPIRPLLEVPVRGRLSP